MARAARNLHSDAYQSFLRRLRAAREAAHFTQTEVALRLGRPQSWVSKSEAGERRVDIVELSELAAIYQRPLDYFVADLPPQRKRSASHKR